MIIYDFNISKRITMIKKERAPESKQGSGKKKRYFVPLCAICDKKRGTHIVHSGRQVIYWDCGCDE